MKIAIFVCGVVRQMDIAYKSWSKLLELNADWYLSTWDISSEAFSTTIFKTPPLPPIDFKGVKISDHSAFSCNTQTIRNGINSRRFLFLLEQFAEILTTYDRIVLLRPDTFLGENTNFCGVLYPGDKRVVSSEKYNNFIQELILVLPPEYFANIHLLKNISNNQDQFNPHIEILKYCDLIGLQTTADFNIIATLARPTSRHRSNPTFSQIAEDRRLWEAMHVSPLGDYVSL